MGSRKVCPLCHGRAWLGEVPCGRCDGIGTVSLEPSPGAGAATVLLVLVASLVVMALALVSFGCTVDSAGIEYDWPRAADVVWRQAYRRQEAPPALDLVRGDRLDCAGGWGFRRPPAKPGDPPGECLDGLFLGEQWRVLVAAPVALRPSSSKLAHEHWHGVLWLGSIADVGHTHVGFGRGGAVDQANELLRGEGLSVLTGRVAHAPAP